MAEEEAVAERGPDIPEDEPGEIEDKGTDDVKSAFFTLISDQRPDKRREAAAWLAASDDELVRKLAGPGVIIASAVNGEVAPKDLSQAVEPLDSLPATGFWKGFSETAGHVLLLKGISVPESDRSRDDFFAFGLRLIGVSMADGFPVSDETIRLVKIVKHSAAGLADDADMIIKRNDSLRPDRPGGPMRFARRVEPEDRAPRQRQSAG